jgi:glycerol-3-phosphate dehydrogenase
MLRDLVDACVEDPSLAAPLQEAPAYLRAEIAYAVTHEGALHLEDVLLHRTRLNYEVADRGLAACPEIADIMAPLLGWDDATKAQEIATYTARADAEADAETQPDDETAERARLEAGDQPPMRKLGEHPASEH